MNLASSPCSVNLSNSLANRYSIGNDDPVSSAPLFRAAKKETGRNSGINSGITKPVEIQALIQALRNVVKVICTQSASLLAEYSNSCIQMSTQPRRGSRTRSMRKNDLEEAIIRRKRGMLESAMRHPIPSSTGADANAGPSMGAEARDAEETDAFHKVVAVREIHMDLHECLLTLLYAQRKPNPDSVQPVLPFPSLDWHGDEEPEEALGWALDGLVGDLSMNWEAVMRAVAHWDALSVTDPDRFLSWGASHAKHVMAIVRAAALTGQGVIVHENCMF
jgi:hypothetical protein